MTSLIEVRIGTDYDVNGKYCGDDDRCMKLCSDTQWHPENSEGGSELEGFPYIDCVIPLDVVGFKNISLRLAGQLDDCRTNQILCGLPVSFPTDRREMPKNERSKNITAIAGSSNYNGLVFTCAKAGQLAQSYAKAGERCENDLNSECLDSECTEPKSNVGFWRLDLDLEFACSAGGGVGAAVGAADECQTDITGQIRSTGLMSLDSFTSSNENEVADLSLASICHAGTIVLDKHGNNRTTCTAMDGTEYRQCSVRTVNPPGTCLFRRPKEARRALGKDYWPWSCPGTDLSADNPRMAYPGGNGVAGVGGASGDSGASGGAGGAGGASGVGSAEDEQENDGDVDYEKAQTQCRSINKEAFDYVESLKTATCPFNRVNHLINYTVYQEYPSLVLSDVCYGIVACSPKESCLGNNQCSKGYEYNKYQCLAWNKKNPQHLNCTSDNQCRTRSGTVTSGADKAGLSSACDPRHSEDCSRCVKHNNEEIGTCECVGGGPRCGLCRLSVTAENSHDGEEYKGYFRLNDECQECPDNPALLLILMAVAVLGFCIGGWYMQDKKVNVAFLSIGVDYFQVLAIFARIKVRWPLWVKQILQILSIFNFNIDLAAPECIIPEFDYKVKWIIMMLLPIIFAGVLLLVFVLVSCFKLLQHVCHLGGKTVRFWSHANKLIAMYTIVFYFIYLTVTRRALDIFNCKEPDPPDGYRYTEFTSIECAGGTCVCDDPSGLQRKLVPWALAGFILYSIGFPLFVFWITWFYRVQIKLDQLLRAHDLGDARDNSISDFRYGNRRFRSRSRNIYGLRKKYHKLYYHFKPGKGKDGKCGGVVVVMVMVMATVDVVDVVDVVATIMCCFLILLYVKSH